MKTISTLEVYLQAVTLIPWVNNAAISQLAGGFRVWDQPTLWVEVSPDYAWLWATPNGLIQVSEETTETGVLFDYRIAL
jgi:hypothetical protein